MLMVGLLMHIDSVITGENAFKFNINIKFHNLIVLILQNETHWMPFTFYPRDVC